jgi:hypothetical protein
MDRLLSKLRQGQKAQTWVGNVSHVQVVTGRPSVAGSSYVLSAAETAPCTCPDFCERDHDNE